MDKLVKFYERCLKEGYDDINDSSILKIKVIAMDCGIKYDSITKTFNEAKSAYLKYEEQLECDSLKAEKQQALQESNGTLIMSLYDGDCSYYEQRCDVFQREDGTFFHEFHYIKANELLFLFSLNPVERVDGFPRLMVSDDVIHNQLYDPVKPVLIDISQAFWGNAEYSPSVNGHLYIYYYKDYASQVLTVKIADAVYGKYETILKRYCENNVIKLYDKNIDTHKTYRELAEQMTYKELTHDTVVLKLRKYLVDHSSPLYDVLSIYKSLNKILLQEEPISEDDMYEEGLMKLETANTASEYAYAYDIFHILYDYKDSVLLKHKSKKGFDDKIQIVKEQKIEEYEEENKRIEQEQLIEKMKVKRENKLKTIEEKKKVYRTVFILIGLLVLPWVFRIVLEFLFFIL